MAKQAIFIEARERFEAQLAKLEAKVAKELARKAAADKKAAKAAGKAAVFTRTSSAKHKGHVGARGRRNQARRDSR